MDRKKFSNLKRSRKYKANKKLQNENESSELSSDDSLPIKNRYVEAGTYVQLNGFFITQLFNKKQEQCFLFTNRYLVSY